MIHAYSIAVRIFYSSYFLYASLRTGLSNFSSPSESIAKPGPGPGPDGVMTPALLVVGGLIYSFS